MSRQPGDTSRTSGADGRSCRLCGAEIQGRRRNGFCGDRCRLRFRRREERTRLKKLFATLDQALVGGEPEAEEALEALRREVLR